MFITGSIILLIIDQIIKYLVVTNIEMYSEIPLISGILSLTYINNPGAAWGMFSGNTWLLTTFTVLVIIGISIFLIKNPISNKLYKTAMMLIYAGAIGNLIDRFFRNGLVVDMIEVKFISFPVFNFADSCIVVGVILLSIYILFYSDDKEIKNG